MNQTNQTPNLFIVGAAKCGTTSVYNYLGNHPAIFGAEKKEPRYLTKDMIEELGSPKKLRKHLVKSKKEYLALYDDVTTEKYILDGSVFIMYFEQSIINLKQMTDDYHIIVMLRNPVDRFISQYKMEINTKEITGSIEEYVKNPKSGLYMNSLLLGRYSTQIRNLYKHLDKNRIKIIFFDDFKKDTAKVMNSLYEFLELENDDSCDYQKVYNKRIGLSKNIGISFFYERNKVLREIKKKLLTTKIYSLKKHIDKKLYKPFVVSPAVYSELYDYYKNEVEQLEQLLKVDLSMWKKP